MRLTDMRSFVVAALLAGAATGLGTAPADAAARESAAAPEQDVSVLAVSLTAGSAAALVGSGVALSVSRRRERSARQ